MSNLSGILVIENSVRGHRLLKSNGVVPRQPLRLRLVPLVRIDMPLLLLLPLLTNTALRTASGFFVSFCVTFAAATGIIAESNAIEKTTGQTNFRFFVDTPWFGFGFSPGWDTRHDGHMRITLLKTIKSMKERLIKWYRWHGIQWNIT